MRCLVSAVLMLSLTGLVFGQARGGSGGRGYSRGFANPSRASHPVHGAAVIVPYPVYYGGYYGSAYGGYYDPSAAGYAPAYGSGYIDDGSQANGPGMPSVV